MTMALEGGEGSAPRPGRSLPPGKTQYPLYRRLGGPQGWSGQVRKISPPTGIWSPDHPARSQSLYWLLYLAHMQLKSMCQFMWQGVQLTKCHKMSPCRCVHHVRSSGSLWTVTKCSEWLVMWTWDIEFCSNAWSVPSYHSLAQHEDISNCLQHI